MSLEKFITGSGRGRHHGWRRRIMAVRRSEELERGSWMSWFCKDEMQSKLFLDTTILTISMQISLRSQITENLR